MYLNLPCNKAVVHALEVFVVNLKVKVLSQFCEEQEKLIKRSLFVVD